MSRVLYIVAALIILVGLGVAFLVISGWAIPLYAMLPKVPYQEFGPLSIGTKPTATREVQIVQVVATNTPAPTATSVPPTATPTRTSTKKANNTTPKTNGVTLNVSAASAQSTQQMGGWTIQYYDGATDQMKAWQFADLVKDWDKYPNVDLPKYQFLAKDGVEYGMAESAYCQRAKTCDINVPAMHYRLVTGDYYISGIDDCVIDTAGAGCAIMLVNVGTVTAMFRESSVDYGFTVEGRYWNGDAMPTAVKALLSSTVYNMMTANTVNPGANCSVPTGCQRLRMTFAIMSGNQLLVKGTQMVLR